MWLLRGSLAECNLTLVIFLLVWYPELPSNNVTTKLQLTSFSLMSRLGLFFNFQAILPLNWLMSRSILTVLF